MLIFLFVLVLLISICIICVRTWSPISISNPKIICSGCQPYDPERTAIGKDRMSQYKVVICGISRDNAGELPIQHIEATGELFQDYRVIVFENDSTDGTRELLQQWQASNSRIQIISKNYNNRKRPNIAFLAKCRNKYLKALRTYQDFDLMMVVDMDMKYGWDINGICDSFAKIDQWDAVGSNGVYTQDGKMWDMFAFRNTEFPQTSRRPDYWTRIVPRGTSKHYCIGTDLMPVDSCFGGLAIYKRAFLDGCRYESPDGDCEHVAFHSMFQRNGGRIVMNPSQVTYYSHYR